MRIRHVFLIPAVLLVMFTIPAAAQDFQREFTLPSGASIGIRNIAGDIKVAGYDGTSIVVMATKQGRDRDRVSIVDASGDDDINVYVDYPRSGNIQASVEFELLVPRKVPYDFEEISSVSGDVSFASIAGQIHTQSVSGAIEIRDVAGSCTASSVSGDVLVRITQNPGAVSMKFASVSGDVTVLAPPDLDAYVDMSTVSGMIWTNFPIRISGRWPFWGRSARGRLGRGTATLKMSSVSGRLSLLVNH